MLSLLDRSVGLASSTPVTRLPSPTRSLSKEEEEEAEEEEEEEEKELAAAS